MSERPDEHLFVRTAITDAFASGETESGVSDLPSSTPPTTTSRAGEASLGPIWGGAIRLDPAGAEVVIGEGIESSASAGKLLGLPAWAAISAGNLGQGLVLPPEIRRVVIGADNDIYGADAANAAWCRWNAEGREERIARPDRQGEDFNDVLRARLARGATP